MYGYMIGSVCGIVTQIDPAGAKFRQSMDTLNSFMNEIELPPANRDKVAITVTSSHRTRI